MKVIIAADLVCEKEAMRSAYCSALMNLAAANRNVVALDADLMNAMGMKPFHDTYPQQFINCGIQEANMIGVSCGLSAIGKIPFAHTFAAFATRRACDQVFISGAYAKSNVKVVGSDPGITAQINGGTHMPFEDMGIMRGIPEMTVLEPVDITMLKWMVPAIASIYGMHYMRLVRKECIKVYEEGTEFKMGKALTLKEGTDVTLIASGFCVAESLKAAEILKQQGISASVINVFCWKPLDEEAIIREAHKTKAVVTAENHNVINGLGSSVAEVLSKKYPVPMEMIGIQDEFGQVGYLDFLSEKYGLTAGHIAKAALKAIKRRNSYFS